MVRAVLDRQPSVGRLMDLCEANYALLNRLIPGLQEMQGEYVAVSEGHTDLHLQVLEHSRYTSLVHLTYYFEHERKRHPEPDALLRVYHDSRQLEVVELRQSDVVLSASVLYEKPGLSNKWHLNWFVNKWLGYCVSIGYQVQLSDASKGEDLVFDL